MPVESYALGGYQSDDFICIATTFFFDYYDIVGDDWFILRHTFAHAGYKFWVSNKRSFLQNSLPLDLPVIHGLYMYRFNWILKLFSSVSVEYLFFELEYFDDLSESRLFLLKFSDFYTYRSFMYSDSDFYIDEEYTLIDSFSSMQPFFRIILYFTHLLFYRHIYIYYRVFFIKCFLVSYITTTIDTNRYIS